MHVAFGHAILKAWGAREQTMLQLGRAIQPPHLVTLLRQHLPSSMALNLAQDRGIIASGSTHGPIDALSTGRSMAANKLPSGPERMGQKSETVLSDNVMFTSPDSTGQVDGGLWPDYDRTDWTYFMHSGTLGGLLDGSI